MTAPMAPAYDLELPEPPARDELLAKADKVRRLALREPEPDPIPEPVAVTNCPICNCDVSGCQMSIGGDGLRRYVQPIKDAWHQGRHFRDLSGGLTHIEGGRRCLNDAKDPSR